MTLPAVASSFWYWVSILSIIIVIFVERKNPQTTITWVLVIAFFQAFGVILYLLLGTRGALAYFFRRRVAKKNRFNQQYAKILYTQLQLEDEHRLHFNSARLRQCSDLVRLHLAQSGSLFTDNNQVELFTEGRLHFEDLFYEIEHAKETIHLEYFIIKNDRLGQRLIELLARKAKEGVEVRLLYDEFGAWGTNMSTFAPLIEQGGKVCRFYTTRLSNLLSANHRNHRKIVVIDGEIGYTGGINIGEEYMGLHPKIHPWRDTHIKLRGGSVSMLQLRFLLDWNFSSSENISFDDPQVFDCYFPPKEFHDGNMAVQIVSSGPDTGQDSIKNGYLKMITDAKETLYIQTPYLIPDETMLQSLRIAAASGVDVRVMVPGVPDKNFVYAITLSYIEELLRAGVRVYLHKGFIHSKTIVMDELASSVGTTNFDIRSFSLNYEVNAFIYDEGFAARCKEVFRQDMDDCIEMTWEEFKKRGIGTRMIESICRLLAYIS